MRRTNAVVAVADYVRDETINRFHVPPRRVVTIPNGVDKRRVHPVAGRGEVRRSFGISPGAPVVLSVGAFTWEKDPLAFLEVANAVVRARPEARFLMVGDGPMRERVETATHDRGLEGHVLLPGARDDIADLMAASDVLLLTSRTEGMPGILIEAGMLGLPAIAYAVGGIPEVVEHGVSGLLVRPGDRATMAAAAADLLGDDVRRRAMAVASRERCANRFEIRGVADRYLEILEGGCAGP